LAKKKKNGGGGGSPRVVGQSEVLKKGNEGNEGNGNGQNGKLYLLTLYSDFLTYRDLSDKSCLGDVVAEMDFRVVRKP
jgi:hypothetical protein